MGDNLYGLSEIVASAFFVYYGLIDASGGYAVGPGCVDIGEAFIVAEVEVGFKAVVGDIALAMFVWIECAGVDIQIGVKFLYSDPETS